MSFNEAGQYVLPMYAAMSNRDRHNPFVAQPVAVYRQGLTELIIQTGVNLAGQWVPDFSWLDIGAYAAPVGAALVGSKRQRDTPTITVLGQKKRRMDGYGGFRKFKYLGKPDPRKYYL